MAGDGFDSRNESNTNVSNVTEKLTAKVVLVCIVAASAGLIFGYDIGVSG